MGRTRLFLTPIWFSMLVLAPASAADRFELLDGDRVVFLGNTLIEREQRYGYWETLLTIRYPRRHIQFRNLGWSGDTVFGDARVGFGSTADGFRHLKEHVLALKPTVIFVGYGLNESFEGQAGLPRFLEGLRVLVDTLAATKARIVLLSPLCQEDLGPPLPDPAEHNRSLRLYRDALRKVAEQRGCRFIDLYDLLGDGTKTSPPAPLTDNGIHPTAYGYWRAGAALERGLGLAPLPWRFEVEQDEKLRTRKFPMAREALPPPLPPSNTPSGALRPGDQLVLRVRGLAPGTYRLTIDRQPVAVATAAEWAAGVKLVRGPEVEQVERLRQAIIEKNRLYFYRWRPQNETYLFGFRKHEQGQNAREIPQFDPLVAKLEDEIARLSVPVSHACELALAGEKAR
jgi:lysophospholipase L1-like esterase